MPTTNDGNLVGKLTDIADAVRGISDIVGTMQLPDIADSINNMSTVLHTQCLIDGDTGAEAVIDMPQALYSECTLKGVYDGTEVSFPASSYADGAAHFNVDLNLKDNFAQGALRLYDAQGARIPLHRAAAFTSGNAAVLATQQRDSARAYAVAMSDFMNCAAINLGVSTGVAVPSRVTSVAADVMADYKATREGTLPSGVTLSGISVMFDGTRPKVRAGFNGAGAAHSFTFDGEEIEPQVVSGTRYVTDPQGALSWDFDKPHTVSVTDGTDTYTLGISPFVWGRSALSGSATAPKNVAKAMWNYWLAAQDFKPAQA